jgi:hypothetical protein
MGQNYTLAQSFQIMDLAGVKFNDSSALMEQKVKNLITGYQNMSVSGGILANSVNAVTFANLQQQSGVQDLISGWTTFFNMVSGGASTFLSFANQTVGLYASMATGGVKLNDTNGKVSASLTGLANSSGSAKVSMTGLNTASVAAQQTFISSAQAAQSNMNALTLMASASGLGTDGTNLLTQASKDYLLALLPAASQSKTMTAILYALAQQGGYQGADSFKELTKWAGNVANPLQNLQGITQTLTQDSAGLTTDVQNLSDALGTTLNNAMAQVIFTESGGIGPMNALAKAIDQTGLNSGTTAAAADNVAGQFGRMTGSVNAAYGEFMTFAETALGLTKSQANDLWQQSLPSVQRAIDALHGKSIDIVANTASASNALGSFQAEVNSLHGMTVQIGAQVVGPAALVQALTLQGYASGGIVGHAASGGWRQGLTMVGELGPEMVRLPQGSQVYPHGVTPGYASQGGGGGSDISVSLQVSSRGQSSFEKFMLEMIRNFVRVKGGGDVQKAFGKSS